MFITHFHCYMYISLYIYGNHDEGQCHVQTVFNFHMLQWLYHHDHSSQVLITNNIYSQYNNITCSIQLYAQYS